MPTFTHMQNTHENMPEQWRKTNKKFFHGDHPPTNEQIESSYSLSNKQQFFHRGSAPRVTNRQIKTTSCSLAWASPRPCASKRTRTPARYSLAWAINDDYFTETMYHVSKTTRTHICTLFAYLSNKRRLFHRDHAPRVAPAKLGCLRECGQDGKWRKWMREGTVKKNGREGGREETERQRDRETERQN